MIILENITFANLRGKYRTTAEEIELNRRYPFEEDQSLGKFCMTLRSKRESISKILNRPNKSRDDKKINPETPFPFHTLKPNQGLQCSLRECPEDAIHFRYGVAKAINIFTQLFNRPPRTVDLGIGHGLPTLVHVRNGRISKLIGVDNCPESLNGCQSNADAMNIDPEKYMLINGDFMSDDVIQQVALQNPDIVASNPPYLPCTDESYPDSVRGGEDGTKYSRLVFNYGTLVDAPVLVTNFASVSNPGRVLEQVDRDDTYAPVHFLVLRTPFGRYTSRLRRKLTQHKPSVYYIDEAGIYWQLIISMILVNKNRLLTNEETSLTSQMKTLTERFKQTGELIVPNVESKKKIDIYYLTPDRLTKLHETFFQIKE